jgi:hypothetical protein
LIPKTIVKLYNTTIEAFRTGDALTMATALDLHQRVAAADWLIVKAGISGTKLALDTYVEKGLGGVPRKPLPRSTDATADIVGQLKGAWEFEQSL